MPMCNGSIIRSPPTLPLGSRSQVNGSVTSGSAGGGTSCRLCANDAPWSLGALRSLAGRS